MHRKTVAAAAVLLALSACSGQQSAGQRSPNATASAAMRNPIDFPLYPGSSLLSTRTFTQVVAGDAGSTIFANGHGTYDGREVAAQTGASFSELSNWVERVAASPPPGYRSERSDVHPDAGMQAERYGIDYAAFSKRAGGREHGLLLIALDPRLVSRRFGVVLGLIARYKALPAMLRAPIDDEAKARIGMTISQATQPDSPIGAALAALDQFEHNDTRGIVLLDAAKRP